MKFFLINWHNFIPPWMFVSPKTYMFISVPQRETGKKFDICHLRSTRIYSLSASFQQTIYSQSFLLKETIKTV